MVLLRQGGSEVLDLLEQPQVDFPLAGENRFDAPLDFEKQSAAQEVDGLALVPKIKKASPETIVVLFSEVPGNETKAREQGADVFLAKPFGVNELFNLVQTFVVEQDPAGDTSPHA